MDEPKHAAMTQTENALRACAVGAAYFLAACFSFNLAMGVGGIATIWPASGIFVSALLLARPAQTLPIVLAVAFASMAANMIYGAQFLTAGAFTIANIAEGLVISQLVIRTSGVPKTLDDTRWLATFFGATLAGSLMSGTIAAVLANQISLPFLISWFITVCLGTLIMTPLTVAIANELPIRRSDYSGGAVMGFVVLLACVAAISWAALSFQESRFLFLPVIGIAAATYQFGARGAAFSITTVAIIATVHTDFGGPVLGNYDLQADTLFLQFYLISLLCAAWPLVALMAEKERLIAQYAETTQLLQLAESTAQVGHWAIGSDYKSLIWSEEVSRMHGVTPQDLQNTGALSLEEKTSLELYHPEDRDRVRDILLAAMNQQHGFAYEARIVRPDGTVRNVSSVGQPRYENDGTFGGLFGTLQDITQQAETLEELQIARSEALREAKTARRLSEVDELTQIANRRKALSHLRIAARTAWRANGPLTIAIFDVDHFKAVNDKHGHHAGDKVLRRIAAIASEVLRPTDLVGRIGGEEFLVILPGEDGNSAHSIIERVRERVEAETWGLKGPSRVTLSAGLATLKGTENIEEALQKADGALYKAKQDGRNLLRIAA